MATSSAFTQKKGRKKCETFKRIWSELEEACLMNELNALLNTGFKSDNGFKSGYLGVVEEGLKQQLPGTDLKANPHISSKISSWKKLYTILYDMIDTSGIGWNDEKNIIELAPNFAWEEFIAKEPRCRLMCNKSWPYFNSWCLIFGKDRETGEGMSDLNNIPPPHSINTDYSNADMHTQSQQNETEDYASTDEHADSQYRVNDAEPVRGKGKKKKRDVDVAQKAVQVMRDYNVSTTSILGELVERVGTNADVRRERKAVDAALKNLTWLSVEDRLNVGSFIMKSPEAMDRFYSIVEQDRHVMLQMILHKYFNRSFH